MRAGDLLDRDFRTSAPTGPGSPTSPTCHLVRVRLRRVRDRPLLPGDRGLVGRDDEGRRVRRGVPVDGAVAPRSHGPPGARRDDPPLDAGSQYTSIRFTETLALQGIVGLDRLRRRRLRQRRRRVADRPVQERSASPPAHRSAPARCGPWPTSKPSPLTTSTGTTTTGCTACSTTPPPKSSNRPTTLTKPAHRPVTPPTRRRHENRDGSQRYYAHNTGTLTGEAANTKTA